MRRRYTLWVTLTILGCLILAMPPKAAANTILAYTGKTFSNIHNEPTFIKHYNHSMRLMGWVELISPLGANCVCTFDTSDPNVVDYSFFDGIVEQGRDFVSFSFTTDAFGVITGWQFFGSGEWNNAPLGASDTDFGSSSVTGDQGFEMCDNCDPSIFQSWSTTAIGSWEVALQRPPWSAVPEPSSLSILLTGLVGLGLLLRQKRLRRD
jgi:hypothetical protein